MKAEGGYRALLVWQQAMDLVEAVYKVTEAFPRSEEFSLKAQLRRTAVSIPSNIAEGSGRGTKRDYQNFLRIARGSIRELDTQLEIAIRIGYLGSDEGLSMQGNVASVEKLLQRLIAALAPLE